MKKINKFRREELQRKCLKCLTIQYLHPDLHTIVRCCGLSPNSLLLQKIFNINMTVSRNARALDQLPYISSGKRVPILFRLNIIPYSRNLKYGRVGRKMLRGYKPLFFCATDLWPCPMELCPLECPHAW